MTAPAKPKDVSRVVLCTGKVAYELMEARDAAGDLGVEDEKTVLQFAKMRAYTHALLFQQRATFRFRLYAAFSKGRVAQHGIPVVLIRWRNSIQTRIDAS